MKIDVKQEEEKRRKALERVSQRAVSTKDKSIIMIPPAKLTPNNVIYYSEHYKKLEGCEDGKAIQTKARKFVELNLVKYDLEKKIYYVLPIQGYNSTTYHLKWNKQLKDFECSCQYYQTKMKKGEKPRCSHNLALWLAIKINNWNKPKK